MTDFDRIYELANKWLKGTITSEEKQDFDDWYNREVERDPEWICDAEEQGLKDRLYRNILESIERKERGNFRLRGRKLYYRWYSVAAAMVLFVVIIWLYKSLVPFAQSNIEESALQIDLPPGREAATLLLADGSIVDLDAVQDGLITTQGTTVVSKQGGEVAYTPPALKEKTPVLYNTIRTARGHQFQVVLPDSTRVWLNSASSLHFPAFFSGKDRAVELTGEAYFEVARDAAMPFRVKVREVQVEVLGTHFNVNAYAEEGIVETTLLEGSVSVGNVNGFACINPGEQAVIKANESVIRITEADIDKVMAWRNGFFEFDNLELPAVMRQISRWYDVDVAYEAQPDDRKFGGRISRNLNLGDVLALLEANGVRFALKGKILSVKY